MRSILKILICFFLISIITCSIASSVESLPESDHPYANNLKYTWPEISEPGATQMRLHFTKMELGLGDKLILLDKDGYELARYYYTSGENFWTPWYTEDTIKVRLETDGSGTKYGFKIDKVETRTDMAPPSALPESYHNYANNFKYTWPEISKPGATQMRLHFTRMELGLGDKLILLDKDGYELARYYYTSGENFWTPWYTEDTIKVRLETDGSGTKYGFKIDKVETRTDMAPPSALPESYHNYANNFKYTWPEISKPGATQMRFHFTRMELGLDDRLILLDKDGYELARYYYMKGNDFWTPWYTEDTMKVRLETDGSGTAYGFKIDKVDTRTDMAPPSALPESYHDYANNFKYTWPEISKPGATQMRFHFTKMELGYKDYLSILDKYGDELTYYHGINEKDFWTPWYTEDTMKVRLETDGSGTAYGFKIDKVETRTDIAPPSALPESYHNYANNFKYTWPEISKPGATQMRFHFTKMELGYKDYLSILDKDGNKLAYYHGINEKDYWTPWYTGDTLKVRLETDGSGTAYGFKIDKVETKPEKTNTPVASFSASPTSGNAPLKVQFTDKSTGSPTSWKWSFGDGKTSTEKNPTHTYSTAGSYTVNLTVSNEKGTASKLATINVSTQSVPPVFPGYTNPPTDLNKDGLYEDINGNGVLDFDDVVAYYDNMDWIEESASVAFFDYNKNGLIDFDDIVKLYDML
ncbi:MAG: PKD domain-containing protein [Methanosarcina sp.]|nr:PKD domain-containing protein [Methanosarcina sp.]MDD4522104.1 PKD domain-containing protein [Methanosarcina sp.]